MQAQCHVAVEVAYYPVTMGSAYDMQAVGHMSKPTVKPLTARQRRALVLAPFPVVRYVAGKSWAGALVNRDSVPSYVEQQLGMRYVEPDTETVYFPDSHQEV